MLARFTKSPSLRSESYKRSLLERCTEGITWVRRKARLGREELSRWFKGAGTRSKVILLTWWYRYRTRSLGVSSALIALALALVFVRYWSALDAHLSGLEKSIIPGTVIGIGAAITGIIAIAFSLSLFAIQQVADRGTPATVQEYARDRLLALVYWVLAILASASFAAALLKADANYRTVAVTVGLASLLLSFILLYFHFRRVARFSDPRYTVWRIYSRGEKQLKVLQKLRDSIVPKTSGTGT